MKDSLGDRMKRYEDVYRFTVQPRTPLIVRVDGKAFHTLTRGCERPFDKRLADAMDSAAVRLVSEAQGARCAFVQSDEVSVLLVDFNTYQSQPWFGGALQKIASVSAGIASATFTQAYGRWAAFDGRAFTLPLEEVTNYFIWRQNDATRNAIQMVGQAHFSHKQLLGKSCDDIQAMLLAERDINFNDFDAYWKRGRMVTPEGVEEVPVFTKCREYVEKFLARQEL